MYKVIDVGSWDGMADAPVELIKVSSKGLTGEDKQSFLQKRAAAPQFMEKLSSLQPGDIPIHVIALGESERYLANRNGDGFDRNTCQSRHHTFVKEARYFRHHANTDKEVSYGRPVASAYNPNVGRVELLVIGNGTKEAAARNGGLVMPSATLSQLERNGIVPWSMGCKLPYDVCAACHNKAASPREYCTADTCVNKATGEKMPGCRDGLNKIGSDGSLQYVLNPNCTWMDISEVTFPADRTAYGYMLKSASGHVLGGAELAYQRGFCLDTNPDGLHKQSTYQKIAQTVIQMADSHVSPTDFAAWFAATDWQPDLAKSLQGITTEKVAACAEQGIWISGPAFAKAHGAAKIDPLILRACYEKFASLEASTFDSSLTAVPGSRATNWAIGWRRYQPTSSTMPLLAVKTAGASPVNGDILSEALTQQYAEYTLANISQASTPDLQGNLYQLTAAQI